MNGFVRGREGEENQGLEKELHTGGNKTIRYLTTTCPKPHKISRHLIQRTRRTPAPLLRSFLSLGDRGDSLTNFLFKVPVHYLTEPKKSIIVSTQLSLTN